METRVDTLKDATEVEMRWASCSQSHSWICGETGSKQTAHLLPTYTYAPFPLPLERNPCPQQLSASQRACTTVGCVTLSSPTTEASTCYLSMFVHFTL